MTDREKLVELLEASTYEALGGNLVVKGFATAKEFADHLIANGVTVQNWIPVTEKLPESQKPVLVVAEDKTFGYRRTLKAAHVAEHECSTEDYEWQEYEGETVYDEVNDCFWIPECWYETNAVENNGNWILDDDYRITHWQPLPEMLKEGAK